MGSGITASHGIAISSFLRDQVVPFLWDQGPKVVTLLELAIKCCDKTPFVNILETSKKFKKFKK